MKEPGLVGEGARKYRRISLQWIEVPLKVSKSKFGEETLG